PSIAQDTTEVVVKAASIPHKASVLGLNWLEQRLPRIQGASWDPYHVCMQNTRVQLVDRIMVWAKGPANSNGANQPSGAEVMLLTAVAGAGKTTVAHTFACQCAANKQLGSSFFFNHETDGRNSPAALFTTIAVDLSRLDGRLAKRIIAAIEDDPTLPSAPIFRQFQELVLKPCQECPIAGPIVLVIDALDEAWDEVLLNILRDHVHRLPSTFRIFLTSRMRPELDSLLRQPHVSRIELDISAQENLNDIAAYIPHKLRELADRRNLGDDWPGERLRAEFIAKADGLFLWVAMTCGDLYICDDPEGELTRLVSTAQLVDNFAGAQMNRLYARILEGFDWTDSSFVSDYRRVMGTAIATKTPITISAMRELYRGQRLATNYTLQKLSPLLTGVGEADHGGQPVRVLHRSLRGFLVIQTPISPSFTQFKIVENEQSQQLALLCVQLLNRYLNDSTPGTGYLAKEEDKVPGVPVLSEDSISEALWYACQFWQDHVMDLESPKEIREALGEFMDRKMILWMEVVAARGKRRGLSDLWGWMQAVTERGKQDKSDEVIELIPQHHKEYAGALRSLSNRLKYEDRQEEALGTIEEAVQIYRKLAADDPAAFTCDLASSLRDLSNRLSDLGRREEALEVIQEVAHLHRRLAADRPAAFTPDLAKSLDDLSLSLSDMGRREDALEVIQEAVQLRRQLVADRPAVFTRDLASSLNNLSVDLASLGRREEALAAIQEAAQLYRQLAADRPASFTPNLALSLNNLSNRLSDLGRREEALEVIREVVQLRRQLASDRPAALTPDLVMPVSNLPNRLQKAPKAIQQVPRLAASTLDFAEPDHSLSDRLPDLGGRDKLDVAIPTRPYPQGMNERKEFLAHGSAADVWL
ncbi:POC1 centriolar protein A, partial [Ceratobasidium sp. 370]